MMAKICLGNTKPYLEAFQALEDIKNGEAGELQIQAIARYFLYTSNLPALASSGWPYKGDPMDPRDQAITDAFNNEWQRLVNGEDDEDLYG